MAQSPTVANPIIKHLFATPLIITELPPDIAAETNARLVKLLLQMEKEMPSQNASNRGGWQSDDKILQWAAVEVAPVMSAFKQIINQVTVGVNRAGVTRGEVNWKINGWANINRKGNANATHIHPGAYWSAVYYVMAGDDEQGGAFQAFDPRGGLPLMYAPTLRIGLEGYMNAGNSETHRPREGQCLLFPSWLPHAVTPYTGDGTRISLAFNFCI